MNIPENIIVRLNEIPIEEVAEKLGLEVRRHKALCFAHDDHNPSITFSTLKNIYKCWVCGIGGGPINLVQDKEGLSFQDACIWLGQKFNVWRPERKTDRNILKRTSPTKIYLTKHKEETIAFDKEVYTWLIDNTPLLELAKKFLFKERCLNEDVILKLRIGSVVNSLNIVEALVNKFGEDVCLRTGLIRRNNNGLYFYFCTPCLLFPYYDLDGSLVGIQSRYLGTNEKAPRFQFMSSQKTRLYNMPILNGLKRGDKLYISEGITDCLALLSEGLYAVAIPSATILPKEDLILLKNYELHMYPDRDEAGQQAFIALRRFFINHYSTVRAETLPEGVKDYCDYYIKKQEINGCE